MKRVLLAVPNEYWLHREVVISIISLLRRMNPRVELMMPVESPVDSNRSFIFKEFLRSKTPYDFLLMMDADNPPDNFDPLSQDILDRDLDVLGFPTPIWHKPTSKEVGSTPFYYNAFERIENDKYGFPNYQSVNRYPKDGEDMIQEVDAVGTGCILIARRVIDALQGFRPFEKSYRPDGSVAVGEDVGFCHKAKKIGFKIFAHFGCICNHFKELSFNEVIHSIRNIRDFEKIRIEQKIRGEMIVKSLTSEINEEESSDGGNLEKGQDS